jgi:hypothetical protein
MPTDTPRRRSPAAILFVPLAAAIVLALFAWPAARLEPRDLPVGVVGDAASPPAQPAPAGALDAHRYADEAAAHAAIEDREVYGAFVATPSGPKVLTASGASPMVAQLLGHAAGEGAQVEDVVPAGPHAAALPSSVLPLVLAGLLTAVAASLLASGALLRTGLLAGASVLGGVAAAALVQSWLDVIGGDFWANAGALSLTIFAIAATAAGLKALLGEGGLVVTALLMVFVGNPFSAVGSVPELLPQPVGWLGQLMPPGAGGNLLRSTGYFDGAGAAGHLWVLAGWALLGLGALAAATLRDRGVVLGRSVRAPGGRASRAATPESAPGR